MTSPIRIGTRGSPLALAQTHMVADALSVTHGLASEIVPITASGDLIQDRPLADVGGKALWTKELDRCLIDGRTDISVHSMKDVETIRPPSLVIAAMLKRADTRDRLIGAASIAALPKGAVIGTSSPRRSAQLLAVRPDLKPVTLRGNVQTRLAKLARGEAGATLLAAAGLDRLGMDIGVPLDLLPAPKRAAPKGRVLPPPPAAADPIPAEYLLHVLATTMPADAALVEEAPSHRPLMQKYLPMRGQDSFYTMASGGLGYAMPASVGVALGAPKRPVVCLIGDGSAMYSIQALWTAAQRKLPLTIVVINNSGYGAMRSFSQVMQVRNVPGLELPGIDFVRLAEGMGCHAVRVSRAGELGEALKRGMAHEGTSLVEVVVDSAVPVLYGQKH